MPCVRVWPAPPPRPRTSACRSRRRSSPDGREVNTSERFEQGRTFPNKFWNAARFALMNLEGYEPAAPVDDDELPPEDLWILSKLWPTTARSTAALEDFEFAEAA